MNIKNSIKQYIPDPLLDSFGKLKVSVLQVKLFFGGIYFTYFSKVYRKNDIILNVPFEMTNLKFRGRFTFDLYEREESEHLETHLSPDAKVLELGACLGFISCLVNKQLKNKDKHVVLEANPNLIKWINKNKEENECEFAVENCIISHQEKNEFFIHKLIVGGSTKRETPNRVEVKGVSFEDLQKKYGVNFDTLIMDIEGGELDILRNHINGIRSFKKIFFEVHPFSNILTQSEAQECEDILIAEGFENVLKDRNFQVWEKK